MNRLGFRAAGLGMILGSVVALAMLGQPAAAAVPAGGRRSSAEWSPEYTATLRRLTLAGNAMVAIVVLTIFFMATHLGA